MIAVLNGVLAPEQTLELVTHKRALLELVDRLIVRTPKGIVMDGPRDAVLCALMAGPQCGPELVQVSNEGQV